MYVNNSSIITKNSELLNLHNYIKAIKTRSMTGAQEDGCNLKFGLQ